MFACPPSTSKTLPAEYRHTAEALFPPGGFSEGKGPTVEAAKAFAGMLCIGEDFKQFWDVYKAGKAAGGGARTSNSGELQFGPAQDSAAGTGEFLDRFQNNLDLLIQKTWVEKAEEIRKENLLDKIPPFIANIENGNYPEALKEFGAILEELAYLFFGAQSQKNDFAEYTLRIDPLFGLFWWYGGQINGEPKWVHYVNKDVLFALLLLGICYLTDF